MKEHKIFLKNHFLSNQYHIVTNNKYNVIYFNTILFIKSFESKCIKLVSIVLIFFKPKLAK